MFFSLPAGSTKKFELDSIGVLVWNLCDGKTSVQQIIRKLAKKYNLNLRESEVACRTFLQMLVKKGLIVMSVPEAKDDKVTR
jgi:predicted transcriptional regulator